MTEMQGAPAGDAMMEQGMEINPLLILNDEDQFGFWVIYGMEAIFPGIMIALQAWAWGDLLAGNTAESSWKVGS